MLKREKDTPEEVLKEEQEDLFYIEKEHSLLWRIWKSIIVLLLLLMTLFWGTFIFASTDGGSQILQTLQAYYNSVDDETLVKETTFEVLESISQYESEKGFVLVIRDNGEKVKVYTKNVLYTSYKEAFEDSKQLRLARITYRKEDGTTRQEWCILAYRNR